MDQSNNRFSIAYNEISNNSLSGLNLFNNIGDISHNSTIQSLQSSLDDLINTFIQPRTRYDLSNNLRPTNTFDVSSSNTFDISYGDFQFPTRDISFNRFRMNHPINRYSYIQYRPMRNTRNSLYSDYFSELLNNSNNRFVNRLGTFDFDNILRKHYLIKKNTKMFYLKKEKSP